MATDLWPHPERNGGRPFDAVELTAALHAKLGQLRHAYRELSRLIDRSAGDPAAIASSESQFSALLEGVAEGYEMVGALRAASAGPNDEAIAATCEVALEMLAESVTNCITRHEPGPRS